MLQTVENVITILILAGALVFFIWEHRINTNKIAEIEKQIAELKDAAKNDPRTNNGCDRCCKDCDDRDVCKGRCIHAADDKTF